MLYYSVYQIMKVLLYYVHEYKITRQNRLNYIVLKLCTAIASLLKAIARMQMVIATKAIIKLPLLAAIVKNIIMCAFISIRS